MKSEITINGAKQPLYFGMKAIKYCFSQPEIFDKKQGETYSETEFAIIAMGGYINQCLLDRVAQTLQFSDFFMWAENQSYIDNGAEVIAMVKAFEESKMLKSIIEKGAELQQSEEKKSQLTGEK